MIRVLKKKRIPMILSHELEEETGVCAKTAAKCPPKTSVIAVRNWTNSIANLTSQVCSCHSCNNLKSSIREN